MEGVLGASVVCSEVLPGPKVRSEGVPVAARGDCPCVEAKVASEVLHPCPGLLPGAKSIGTRVPKDKYVKRKREVQVSSGGSDTQSLTEDSEDEEREDKLKMLRQKLSSAKRKLKKRGCKMVKGRLVKRDEVKKRKVKEVEVPGAKVSVNREGKPKRQAALEVFCGSAGLTAELNLMGFQATGIDWRGNKDRPKSRCLNFDLTEKEGQVAFWKLVEDLDIIYAHFAPPCGTSSRAREVRRRNADGTQCTLDPKPLRSDEFPDGVPGLEGQARIKVDKANVLYMFVAEAVYWMDKRGIAWTIENPSNSLMWCTKPFKQLWYKQSKLSSIKELKFQMCMHGGSRNKKVSIWHSGLLRLKSLAVLCDGMHEHKPWGLVTEEGGLFATAEERCYPPKFCKRFAAQVAKDLYVGKVEKDLEFNVDRVHAESQPRKGLQEVIPEFKEIVKVAGCSKFEVEDLQKWQEAGRKGSLDWRIPIQEGDKLLGVARMGVIGGPGSFTLSIGKAWSQFEFVKQSEAIRHPFDREIKVPPAVAGAFWNCALRGPSAIEQQRLDVLNWYKERAKALEVDEKVVKGRLHPEVREVIKEKNVLVFAEMLRDIKYDDLG